MSTPSLMRAQARAMMPLFETAIRTASDEGINLPQAEFFEYRHRLLDPFASHPNLKRLAIYAIDDAVPLVTVTAKALADVGIVGDQRRAAIHHSSDKLLGPSWMDDAFMHHFTDRLTKADVSIARPLDPAGLPQLSWRDFDYFFTASSTGCPAHELPLSDTLPQTGIDVIPGVSAPKTFLDQFFRLTADVVLTGLESTQHQASTSDGTVGPH